MKQLPLGFIPEQLRVSLERILPSRKMSAGLNGSKKFKQIKASIEAVGLIEPLTISRADKESGLHTLLDGHIRLLAMHELGYGDAPCLVATDDETYTYNNRISRLSSVQEHLMIRRAVERGVTPARLAQALDVDVSQITRKLNLLDGICPEAAEMLEDQHFSANVGGILRKMKSMRQIECVELMVSANNLTVSYAEALLAATPGHQLIQNSKPQKIRGVSSEQMAKMEQEMGNLQERYRLVEQSYGQDVLNLVLTRGYLTKLLDNPSVVRYLTLHQPDVLHELQNIVQATSLDGAA